MLAVDDLRVIYAGDPPTTAVDGVSLEIARGEVVGLVGESGSGKSTVARVVSRVAPAASGRVVLDGVEVTNAQGAALRSLRRTVQLVSQDPRASLNPRMTVGGAIEEAALAAGLDRAAARRRAEELFALVQLPAVAIGNYPHQFSGGQLQRVAIARALAAGPRLLLLDEVTASLDVSVQATILNLLREIREELGLTFLFISHDLAVIRYLSRRVYVMKRGRIVESGPVDAIFAAPQQEYTRRLMAAVPTLGGARWRAGPRPGEVGGGTREDPSTERNATT
jgi:peptide/nickel transport system ATP-binding protein